MYYVRITLISFCLSIFATSTLQAQTLLNKTEPTAAIPTIADKLTARGERLFSEGKLTRPEEENAYTLFRAAQIIEPDHEAADAGLKAILIAKTSDVKDIIALSKFKRAGSEIRYLKTLYPDSNLLTSLESDLHDARKAYAKKIAAASAPVVKPDVDNGKVIDINETALNAKSQELIDELSELAKTIAKTNEGVLIYARSDAQARWMYQQMRKAVPGYRVRGDLRIGTPSIQLLKPFN